MAGRRSTPAAPALREIERKFLVRRLPPAFARRQGRSIVQGYLAVSPDGTEVRVRNCGGEYFLTIKHGTGVSRSEVELKLTEAQFMSLWPLTRGQRISKTRFALPHPAGALELDVFRGPLQGLMTVEIEFPTRRASRAFQPPNWFGPEITHREAYRNRTLALGSRVKLAAAHFLAAEHGFPGRHSARSKVATVTARRRA